ncbi:MAG: nitroreductase family protein [Methanosarcinaceae archaeon]|nr:nitroreductase family protein [Methanosarcinaceae archaeon]
MSNMIDTILARRSVREFTGGIVSKQDICTILNCGRWAPSGLNNQPWKFVVVQERDTIDQLSQCTHYRDVVKGANVLIGVYLDTDAQYNHTKDILAIGAAVQNMLLACEDMGLGAVWLGEILNQSDQVNTILHTPTSLELMAVLAIGYPVLKERTSHRKDFGEIACNGMFGKPWT